MCATSVQWILARDGGRGSQLPVRFVPLQSPLGRALREDAKVPDTVDSMLWMELVGTEVIAHRYTDAVIRSLEYLGGIHRWGLVLRLVPRVLRDFGYRMFARYRLRVMSPRCLVPSPEERARFLSGHLPGAPANER